MGCYWSPLNITLNSGGLNVEAPSVPSSNTNLYHSGDLSVGVDPGKGMDLFSGEDVSPPTTPEAVNGANRAVLEKGAGLGLSISAMNYSTPYQNALLMHILNPAKWGYNPQLTRYCGMKPYILIGIIDYCGAFVGPTKVREEESD